MNESSDKHLFALYYPQLSIKNNRISLTDSDLMHRITHVLRMNIDDSLILFNATHHVSALIRSMNKKQIEIEIQSVYKNKMLTPHITFLLPILKRENLHEVIYSLVETGVNEIQLITTQKIQRAWGKEQELEKLQKIVAAACEQSKQFAMPTIHAPVSLEKVLSLISDSSHFLYADPQGESSWQVMQTIKKNDPSHITLMMGPEGDLTIEEKEMLKQHNAIFCALTPTILRSVQAGPLFAGMIRSILC